MVRRAWSGQETENPEGRQLAVRAPIFSDGSWTDLHLSNDLRSWSKLNIKCQFSLSSMVNCNSITSAILASNILINLNAEKQKNETIVVFISCLFANAMIVTNYL